MTTVRGLPVVAIDISKVPSSSSSGNCRGNILGDVPSSVLHETEVGSHSVANLLHVEVHAATDCPKQ